jgi:hypothetical protein
MTVYDGFGCSKQPLKLAESAFIFPEQILSAQHGHHILQHMFASATVYVCMCATVCIYVSMYVYKYVGMYMCMHACMHAYTHVCMYVCMYVCI